MPTFFNEIRPLPKPIDFPCVVERRKLTASITHVEDNPINVVYHLQFSDGYKTVVNSTELDPPHEWWDNNAKRGNTAYARAIAEDLNAIITTFDEPDGKLNLVVVDFENENDVNIWAVKDSEDIYSIYWHGKYQFTIERTKEGWKFYDVRVLNPQPINEGLAVYITQQIDKK